MVAMKLKILWLFLTILRMGCVVKSEEDNFGNNANKSKIFENHRQIVGVTTPTNIQKINNHYKTPNTVFKSVEKSSEPVRILQEDNLDKLFEDDASINSTEIDTNTTQIPEDYLTEGSGDFSDNVTLSNDETESADIDYDEILNGNTTVEDMFRNVDTDVKYSTPKDESTHPKSDIIQKWLTAQRENNFEPPGRHNGTVEREEEAEDDKESQTEEISEDSGAEIEEEESYTTEAEESSIMRGEEKEEVPSNSENKTVGPEYEEDIYGENENKTVVAVPEYEEEIKLEKEHHQEGVKENEKDDEEIYSETATTVPDNEEDIYVVIPEQDEEIESERQNRSGETVLKEIVSKNEDSDHEEDVQPERDVVVPDPEEETRSERKYKSYTPVPEQLSTEVDDKEEMQLKINRKSIVPEESSTEVRHQEGREYESTVSSEEPIPVVEEVTHKLPHVEEQNVLLSTPSRVEFNHQDQVEVPHQEEISSHPPNGSISQPSHVEVNLQEDNPPNVPLVQSQHQEEEPNIVPSQPSHVEVSHQEETYSHPPNGSFSQPSHVEIHPPNVVLIKPQHQEEEPNVLSSQPSDIEGEHQEVVTHPDSSYVSLAHEDDIAEEVKPNLSVPNQFDNKTEGQERTQQAAVDPHSEESNLKTTANYIRPNPEKIQPNSFLSKAQLQEESHQHGKPSHEQEDISSSAGHKMESSSDDLNQNHATSQTPRFRKPAVNGNNIKPINRHIQKIFHQPKSFRNVEKKQIVEASPKQDLENSSRDDDVTESQISQPLTTILPNDVKKNEPTIPIRKSLLPDSHNSTAPNLLNHESTHTDFDVATESRMNFEDHEHDSDGSKIIDNNLFEDSLAYSNFDGRVYTEEGAICGSLIFSIKIVVNETSLRLPQNITVEEKLQDNEMVLKWEGQDNVYNISTLFKINCENDLCAMDSIHVTLKKRPTIIELFRDDNVIGESVEVQGNNLKLFETELGTLYHTKASTVLSMEDGVKIYLSNVEFFVANERKSVEAARGIANYSTELIGGGVGILLVAGFILFVFKKLRSSNESFKPNVG